MIVEIPITNDPNQKLAITLPRQGGNITLEFYFAWNRIANYWQMNITDSASNTQLISGLPMLTGVGFYANLLAQYQYLEIGGLFVIPNSAIETESPGETDWDGSFTLAWADV